MITAVKILLMVVACFVSGWAFFLYNEGDIRGKSHPKIVTWSLLALIVILNVASYKLTSNDIFVTILPAVNAAMTVLTFFFLLFNHIRAGNGLKLPNKTDRVILVAVTIVIVIVVAWQDVKIASYANIITQICSFVAFIPTLRRLQDEDPRPWLMWSGSFLLVLIVLLLNWQGRILALVYPGGGMIGHFIIGVISSIKRKKTKPVNH